MPAHGVPHPRSQLSCALATEIANFLGVATA